LLLGKHFNKAKEREQEGKSEITKENIEPES
jgi:hypothetical protein